MIKKYVASNEDFVSPYGTIYKLNNLTKAGIKYSDIPKYTAPLNLTSNNTSEWEITASSIYDSNFEPYKVFDGVYSEYNVGWFSQNNSTVPQWIQWKNLTRKVNIKTYLLQFNWDDGGSRHANSWKLQGSNDEKEWIDLDEENNFESPSDGYLLKKTIENNRSFYCHRLYITSIYNQYVGIGEIKCWNGLFNGIWKDIVCYYPLADDDTDQIKIIKSTSNNISKTDDGYLFNGSNSYINLGRQMFESVNNQITLAGWIKPNSLTKDQRLISKTEGGDWQIGINEVDFPNYVCGYLRLNGTYYNPKFNVNDLNVNEWNHLALTYDGSSIKLYHNFVIKDTISVSGTISHSSAPCMIGAEPNNNGYAGSTFDGLIKKVGVWSRGLTEEEIKKL